jgi:hypothetical protein
MLYKKSTSGVIAAYNWPGMTPGNPLKKSCPDTRLLLAFRAEPQSSNRDLPSSLNEGIGFDPRFVESILDR